MLYLSLKLVAIDLDATLLRDDKSYDMERFDYLVDELTKQDVTFMIASGNENKRIRNYLSADTLSKVYVAGNNGNQVEFNGKHIHANNFSKETLLEIAEIIETDPDCQMMLNTENYTFSTYISEKDKDYINLYYEDIHMLDSYEDLPNEEVPIKVAILSSKPLDETKQMADKINSTINGVAAVTSGGGWFDIYHEEGGKGSAVKWVQDSQNIQPDESMAFGDSLNDSTMMPLVHYSITMNNADDEFKAFCNYEIGSNQEQAVIEILESIAKESNLDFMEKFKRI